jgi:hypothetical protein
MGRHGSKGAPLGRLAGVLVSLALPYREKHRLSIPIRTYAVEPMDGERVE